MGKSKKPSSASRRWLWQLDQGQIDFTHGEKIRHLKSVGFLTKHGKLTMKGSRELTDLRLLMQARKDIDNHVKQAGGQQGTDSLSENVGE